MYLQLHIFFFLRSPKLEPGCFGQLLLTFSKVEFLLPLHIESEKAHLTISYISFPKITGMYFFIRIYVLI